MTEVEQWACAYVSSMSASFGDLTDQEKLAENLFTSGRLDSLQLMYLLLDAEKAFDFAFTPEAFQDRRLHTIAGLAKVVSELKVKGAR